MNKKQWIVEYLLVTGFGWGIYLSWLIPFQLFWVKMTWEQFTVWLLHGTLLELGFAYFFAKITIKYVPRITKWVKENIK